MRGYCIDSDDEVPLSPLEYSDYSDGDRAGDEDCDETEMGMGMEMEMGEEAIRTFNIRIRPYPPSPPSTSPSRSLSPSRSPTKLSLRPPRPPQPPPPNLFVRTISYIAGSTLPTRYIVQLPEFPSTTPAPSTSQPHQGPYSPGFHEPQQEGTHESLSPIGNSGTSAHGLHGSTPSLSLQSSHSSTRSVAMSVIDSVTYWRELREAETDADLERTVGVVQGEWYQVGTLVSLWFFFLFWLGFNFPCCRQRLILLLFIRWIAAWRHGARYSGVRVRTGCGIWGGR